MKSCDAGKWKLNREEESDNNNEYHGGVVGIPLTSVPALLAKPKY